MLVVLVPMLYPVGYAQGSMPPDSFLNRMEGTWQGDGKAFGYPARLQLKAEWVLGNKFLRLSLRNAMGLGSGQPQLFEGHAYYGPVSADKYQGSWFDSRGKTFPIKAQRDGDSLVALWGTPEEEEGKSVYRLIEPGKLEVVDSVRQKDGTWKEFGRAIVSKQ